MKKPFLLSPAGDGECLKAAVYGGADEVYFGLSSFNARANAANFTPEKAAEAIAFCRVRGVKTNITLNTLLYEREYRAAVALVGELEGSMPPDAYIIQDIGLARLLVREFPGITLHASTQLQIHGAYSVPVLKRLGFSRAVLAREMSAEDIAAFAATDMETEVFIHGAMCVCRSGGCLMSSMIGKRSGNRGECAYPCRMEYNGGYPLSLKDLCLAGRIPELAAAGVTALKIEGRMKSPRYVYGVTRVYRKLIDENRAANADELKYLSELFSRNGFTEGYYTGKIGSAMFGIRSDRDKASSRAAEEATVIVPTAVPADITVKIRQGEPSVMTVTAGTASATVMGFTPEAAKTPANTETVLKNLLKLGGTDFSAARVDADIDPDAFCPVSLLNSLRRDAISAVTKTLLSKNAPVREIIPPIPPMDITKIPSSPVLRFESDTVNEAILSEAGRVEIPLWKIGLWKPLLPLLGERLSLILPGFVFDGDTAFSALLTDAKAAGVTSFTLPNASFVSLFTDTEAKSFALHADYGVNCVTAETANTLFSLGFSSVCASAETGKPSWSNAEKVVYGRLRLMSTRNCIIKNTADCRASAKSKTSGKGCTDGKGGALTDRTNAVFPIFCDYRHSNSIYNSVCLWLFDKYPALCGKTADISPVIIFTDEDASRQAEIMAAFRNAAAPEGKFTRAYG